MTDKRDEAEIAYQCGIRDGRAGVVSDLRCIIDFINGELRGMRNEIRAIAGLPPLPLLDHQVNGRPQ